MRKLALFSTWNKDGVGSIARALMSKGFELVATGKTRIFLEGEGLKVTEVSLLTGEPERFGGRLKTLHHSIFGGILFRPGLDETEWPFDFRIGAVVCNFYPFAEMAPKCEELGALTEWIDVGGPAMVRAAAKNFSNVWVFTKPEQYTRFIALIDDDARLRERLALEAFENIVSYDEEIAFQFQNKQGWSDGGSLVYGENPHQKATFLPNRRVGPKYYGNLSYNNVRDAEAALRFIAPFHGPAVSVVKHQTLCGSAAGLKNSNGFEVFNRAWEGDPMSRFGGVVGFNFVPDEKVNEILNSKFIELLVLPRSTQGEAWAEQFRKKKERVKIVLIDFAALENPDRHYWEVHQGILGKLKQEADSIDTTGTDRDLVKLERVFGEWAASCSKSNAMVLTGLDENQGISFLAGAGQGQPNRVDALQRLAIPRALEFCKRTGFPVERLTCFSDAFLPFPDCLSILKEAGISKLVQPGGSKNDEVIADEALKLGVDMRIEGLRHFWH